MDPFLGQVILFAGNFAPRGWALCDGQLLPISQYSALFSILGTMYGGDGRTTFALPDLRGRVPMHAGSGPGLSPRRLGERAGAESHTLTVLNLPSHSHSVQVTGGPADSSSPAGALLTDGKGPKSFDSGNPPSATMKDAAIRPTGGGQAVANMQPYAVLNYIIALQGVFPSRS